MRITKVKVKVIETPLKEPFRIALGTITMSRTSFVEIETDEGITGYGEGAPAVLVNGDTLEGTIKTIEVIKNEIIGIDPMNIERIYWTMNRCIAHNPSAKAAIDIAIHDLIGKATKKPLYKILGGYDSKFETDLTVGINEPSVMANKAKEAVAQGFDTIKIKVGTGFEDDIRRVKSIREAVGSGVKIRVDANQAWSSKEAVRIIDRIAEYDIELVEQPVPYYDIEGLAEVTKNTSVPIMADESVFDSKDALKIVKYRAADLINIKLMKCGGISEALKINSIAEAAGIECMLGCMAEETNIGITAAASLGAAIKNITRADLDATFFLSALPVSGGVSIEGRIMTLSDEPGLGIRK